MLRNDWPLNSLLTSQEGMQNGIVSLLMWDDSIFQNFNVPQGLDKNVAIDYILSKAGKTPLMHPDPDYMKYYIGTWSTVRNPIWEKLYASTQFEYNPIYNTDRTSEITDSRSITRNKEGSSQRGQEGEITDSGNSSATGNTTDTGNVENQVSAENASTYQPEAKEIRDLESESTQTTTTSATRNSTETEKTQNTEDETTTETYTHSEHAEGNIGVTTTQQMIKEEREIVDFSVYDVIVRDFVEQFCLLVW